MSEDAVIKVVMIASGLILIVFNGFIGQIGRHVDYQTGSIGSTGTRVLCVSIGICLLIGGVYLQFLSE
jgi:hypothetical protein